MSTPTLEIVEAGIFTTVQDRGRYGYQRIGVPVSGAMDEFALRAANILVGNAEDAAGLELTVSGPTIRFVADTWIAVTGGDLSATLDGEPLPYGRSVEVPRNAELRSLEMRTGTRAYLAVAGGIDVPLVMGSRSTYVTASFGGLDGRPLQQGDLLATLPVGPNAAFVPRELPEIYLNPDYGSYPEIRVVLGPQHESFDEESIARFLSSVYVVSPESNRMGYRLDGPPVPHLDGPGIVSDGNPMGAIQIPGDGLPRLLMSDRGTTGGYTKIATVISSDLGALAQAAPGDRVMFKAVPIEEAHELLRAREDILRSLSTAKTLQGYDPNMRVVVDGEAYDVATEDGGAPPRGVPAGDAAEPRTYHVNAKVSGQTHRFDVEVGSE